MCIHFPQMPNWHLIHYTTHTAIMLLLSNKQVHFDRYYMQISFAGSGIRTHNLLDGIFLSRY